MYMCLYMWRELFLRVTGLIIMCDMTHTTEIIVSHTRVWHDYSHVWHDSYDRNYDTFIFMCAIHFYVKQLVTCKTQSYDTHTYTYAHIHTHTHTYTYIHIHVHTHAYTYMHIHIHTARWFHTCITHFHYTHWYRVAKTHRIPYLYRSFSAKEPYI